MHGCEPEAGSRLLRESLCSLQLAYQHIPRPVAPHGALPHLEDPNTGFRTFGASQAIAYLDDTYRLGPSLSYTAGLPEPNLGDPDRTSWLTTALAWLPVPVDSK